MKCLVTAKAKSEEWSILLNTNQLPIWGQMSGRMRAWMGMALVFFGASLASILVFDQFVGGSGLRFDPALLAPDVLARLVVLLLLYFLADGLRLYCVIRSLGCRVPFGYLFQLVFANMFVSNITPMASGGGFLQVYMLQRRGMAVGEATAATSVRTVLAALMLFSLTPVILWSNPDQFGMFFRERLLMPVIAMALAWLGGFGLVIFRIRWFKRLLYGLMRLLQQVGLLSSARVRAWFLRLSAEMDEFSHGFRRFWVQRPGWALMSVLSTAVFLLLLFSFSLVLLHAMGYQVPALSVLSYQVVVTFFMYFAPTPGGAGVAEGGYGLLFAQLVSSRDVATLTLAWRGLTIYLGVLIGMLLMLGHFMRLARSGGVSDA